MQVKIKKLHPDAITPTYATDGSACFDLYALDDGTPHPRDTCANIYRTGIAVELPKDYVLNVFSRSGQGFNQAARLSNAVGQIDSDYRGEIMVALRFDGVHPEPVSLPKKGDRIAQARPSYAPQFEIAEVDSSSITHTKSSGFNKCRRS